MTPPSPSCVSYLDEATPGVLRWLESVRFAEPTDRSPTGAGWGRWRYHAATDQPFSTNATSWAVLILHDLGHLYSLPNVQRVDALEFLRGAQDYDGYFKDPLVGDGDLVGKHSWEDVYGQWTVAADAIEALGDTPLRALPPVQFADLGRLGGRAYTRAFDWSDPWARGEAWSRGIIAYLRSNPPARRDARVVDDAIDVFEAEVLDPATGMPSVQMPELVDTSCAMAGLFKTMNAYLATGRPVPHARRAIDSTLRLQRDDDDFGQGQNMCLNWDALWVLRELDRQLVGTHRHAEIVDAGNRLARRLLRDYRKPDGGFAFHRAHCVTHHHSVRLCEQPAAIGDMLGTMMCLNCLRYADQWNATSSDNNISVTISHADARRPDRRVRAVAGCAP